MLSHTVVVCLEAELVAGVALQEKALTEALLREMTFNSVQRKKLSKVCKLFLQANEKDIKIST